MISVWYLLARCTRRLNLSFQLAVFIWEIIISDVNVERTVQAIVSAAKTGEAGDGKIFISTVEQAINIRTGLVDETIDELQPDKKEA